MPTFSRQSAGRLATCHPDLRRLLNAVLAKRDTTILEGVRSDARQAELYRQGRSKLDGVRRRSKHQRKPDGYSHAVDAAPYPVRWNTDATEVYADWIAWARVVLETADELGIRVRWGGDWDRDWDRVSDPRSDADQRFNDWPHWELG